MKKALPYIIAVIIAGGALVPVYLAKHASPDAPHATVLDHSATNIQKVSYALGYQVSSQAPADIDVDTFAQGMRDGHAKKQPQFTQQEITQALMAYQQDMQKKAQAEHANAEKAGDTFLAENAKKPGVVTTASGLQYQVIKEGTGKQPSATSSVTVNYEGKLINGKVFDSSIARHEPATFPLNQVIPGWTEGLQLMKEGGEYRFFIPAKLGYGETGAGETIPPNSVLIFDVTLIKVNS